MKPAQAITAILGIGSICVMLTGCDLEDIGDARTARELAPSLEALREAVPEHHRRLADGTFDSLSILEQWDFVAEVEQTLRMRRYLARRFLEAGLSDPVDETEQQENELEESERAAQESFAKLLESASDMTLEHAELSPSNSRFVLRHLKLQDSLEQATKSPIGWLLTWYWWKTDNSAPIEVQPVFVNANCGSGQVQLFLVSRGSQGFEAVEVPVIVEDCP